MRTVRTMATWTAWLARLGPALVALVLAHNLVFVQAYGSAYPNALARTGHDDAWTTAVLIVLALGLALLAAGLWQLHRLGRAAASAPLGSASTESAGSFAADLLRSWAGLTASTAALFVVQENLEHVVRGEPLPGAAVLVRAGSPVPLTIVAAVAFALALVGALYRWRRDVLTARIAAARARWRLEPALPRRSQETDRRPLLALGGSIRGRAPPAHARS
jgi:hypothetical protein